MHGGRSRKGSSFDAVDHEVIGDSWLAEALSHIVVSYRELQVLCLEEAFAFCLERRRENE